MAQRHMEQNMKRILFQIIQVFTLLRPTTSQELHSEIWAKEAHNIARSEISLDTNILARH